MLLWVLTVTDAGLTELMIIYVRKAWCWYFIMAILCVSIKWLLRIEIYRKPNIFPFTSFSLSVFLSLVMTSIAQLIKASDFTCTGGYPVQASEWTFNLSLFLSFLSLPTYIWFTKGIFQWNLMSPWP